MKKTVISLVLIAVLVAAAGVVYMNYGSSKAQAAGCGMSGMDSDMSGCPMNGGGSGSGHDGHHSDATVGPTGQSVTAINGTVVAVNKAQRTVSLRLDLPVTGDAAKAISKVRTGDTVTATIALDKSGNPVVTGIAQGKGQTATLGITGIQCQACADRLQSSLKSVPGVKSVTVTAHPARAIISYDQAKTSIEDLKDAIRNTKPIHADTPFGVEG